MRYGGKDRGTPCSCGRCEEALISSGPGQKGKTRWYRRQYHKYTATRGEGIWVQTRRGGVAVYIKRQANLVRRGRRGLRPPSYLYRPGRARWLRRHHKAPPLAVRGLGSELKEVMRSASSNKPIWCEEAGDVDYSLHLFFPGPSLAGNKPQCKELNNRMWSLYQLHSNYVLERVVSRRA